MKNLLSKIGKIADLSLLSEVQRKVVVANNSQRLFYAWVWTNLYLWLTNYIGNTEISLAGLLPNVMTIILKPVYDRNKKMFQNHLDILLILDVVFNIIGGILLAIGYAREGYILINILFNSIIQPLIDYSCINLNKYLFSTVEEQNTYNEVYTPICSAANIIGYALSVSIAPIMPMLLKITIFVLSGSLNSVFWLRILKDIGYYDKDKQKQQEEQKEVA